jgi:hypothetical protein
LRLLQLLQTHGLGPVLRDEQRALQRGRVDAVARAPGLEGLEDLLGLLNLSAVCDVWISVSDGIVVIKVLS